MVSENKTGQVLINMPRVSLSNRTITNPELPTRLHDDRATIARTSNYRLCNDPLIRFKVPKIEIISECPTGEITFFPEKIRNFMPSANGCPMHF